jgi:Glycosyltransferase
MKIVHVVDSMEVGGAETLVSQMCRMQREQGHQVEVYAVAALGPLGEQLRSEGFTVLANIGNHLSDSLLNFYRHFKESRPDVVHIHNPTPTIYAAPGARLAGVPSIVSTRHSLVASPHNRTMEFKYSIAARFCDWVVGICDATADNIKSLHTVSVNKIVRIYNGAKPLAKTAADACPAKSGFTLTFVGRLQPVKNLSLLLRGFHVALKSDASLRLWIVGDGSERARLEGLASDLGITNEITFWGQQLYVAPFFSAADTFVMSSQSEGLPISLLQAFSMGLPAIVTDVGGMAEVVRFAKAGFVVALNPDEMASSMLRMKEDCTARNTFAENGLAAFEEHFSLETMVAAYHDLYLRTPRTRRSKSG